MPPMWTMAKTREEVVRSHLAMGAWGLRGADGRRGRPIVLERDDGGAGIGGGMVGWLMMMMMMIIELMVDCGDWQVV